MDKLNSFITICAKQYCWYFLIESEMKAIYTNYINQKIHT